MALSPARPGEQIDAVEADEDAQATEDEDESSAQDSAVDAPSGDKTEMAAGAATALNDGGIRTDSGTGPMNGSSSCDGSACGDGCEPGFHTCSGSCVSDTALTSCGARCTPCPAAPSNATATCTSGTCGFQCASDYVENAGACVRKDLYVSVNGSDSGDGTATSPFRTYERATNGAVSGQVISFSPGSYAEAFTRAIPAGTALQRTAGATGTVRFVGTGVQELLFAGGGSLRDITIDGFGTPISASSGRQNIERVSVTSPYGPVRLAGSAVTTMMDVAVSGAPAIGSDARPSLVKLIGSAQLMVRGTSRFSGSFRCDYPNDPPPSTGVFAAGASLVDMEGTQISGAIYSAALFLDGTSTARLKDVAVAVDAACHGASVSVRESASAFVNGGTYAYSFVVGVIENTGRPTVEINGGSFTSLSWNWRGSLRVRNASFSEHVGLIAPIDGTSFDLGTADSPGGNTFQDGTRPNGEYFFALNRSTSGTLYVDVSGNRWIPNEQGASASGRYEVGTTSAKYPAQGRNFAVDSTAVLRF